MPGGGRRLLVHAPRLRASTALRTTTRSSTGWGGKGGGLCFPSTRLRHGTCAPRAARRFGGRARPVSASRARPSSTSTSSSAAAASTGDYARRQPDRRAGGRSPGGAPRRDGRAAPAAAGVGVGGGARVDVNIAGATAGSGAAPARPGHVRAVGRRRRRRVRPGADAGGDAARRVVDGVGARVDGGRRGARRLVHPAAVDPARRGRRVGGRVELRRGDGEEGGVAHRAEARRVDRLPGDRDRGGRARVARREAPGVRLGPRLPRA